MSAIEQAILDPQQARGLVDRIKAGAEALSLMIEDAYLGQAWVNLDYRSWDELCSREFGHLRLRLPREERQEVVASLRSTGLSIRAIASATGISDKTVQRDLRQVSEITTPEPPVDAANFFDDDQEMTDALVMADAPAARFEEALAEAKAEGDLSRANVVRKITAAAPPTQHDEPRVIGVDGKRYPASQPRVERRPPNRRAWPTAFPGGGL